MKSRAFTLIEIIVALGIFSIVAVVALGALLRIINANNKAQTLQSALTNLNFALETMSRELRVGLNYHCEPAFAGTFDPNGANARKALSCATGQNGLIAFESSKTAINGGTGLPCQLVFAYAFDRETIFDPWQLKKAEQVGCNDVLGINVPFSDVVSPEEITITDFRVMVDYAVNQRFPMAFIYLSGEAGVEERNKTLFEVQTAASAREPSIP